MWRFRFNGGNGGSVFLLWWRFEFVNGVEDGEVSVVYKVMDEFEVEGVLLWRCKSLRVFMLKLMVVFNNVDFLN